MKTTILLALLLALAPSAGASGAGADPFNFLFLDANARPVALGGAYTALAADSNSLLYNPAGLGANRGHEATFMHNQYFQGIAQDYAAYASPLGWGANVNSLRFGDTTKTSYSNPSGTGLGEVGLSDLAFGAGYGREVVERLRVGAGFKLIRETIAGVSGQGYALDLGVQHDPLALPGLTLGLALQNLGPAVKFQRAAENLPLNLRLGAAYRFSLLGQANTASFDLTKERSESPLFGLGVETVAGGVLPIRLGFASRDQAGLGVTFGLGWRHRNVAIDYALAAFGDLGSAHRVSLTLRWGNTEDAAVRAESAAKEVVRSRDTPTARFNAADREAAHGNPGAARRELEAARRLLPPGDRRLVTYFVKSGGLALDAGDMEQAQGLFIDAIRAAQDIATAGPSVAAAYLGLARCLEFQGNLGASREALHKALEVDPSDRQREDVHAALRRLEGKRPAR